MRLHDMRKNKKSLAQSGTAAPPSREREGKLIQARISDEAYKKLAARAKLDTRTMSNYIEHLVYRHLETE